MNKIITVYSQYGICELNVEKIIALVPKDYKILFEFTYWILEPDDFYKVSKLWHEINSI